MIYKLSLIALLAGWPLAAVAQDHPLRGVALVIGESKYDQLPQLGNPSKDARDIDRLLGDLGFDVDRVLNADGDEMRDAIARFEDEAKDADVALVYYSGHGIEAKGQNFIAPIDTDISSPEKAGASLVAVQPMLEELAKIVPVSIVLLDACRSDPFPSGTMVQLPGEATPVPVSSEGLAAIRGPVPLARKNVDPNSLGSVIGFAAEPGEPALDGAPGENSPYAAALLKHFAAGGYSFGDVMTMVGEEVYLKTKAQQLPWTNSSLRRTLTFSAPEDQAQADGDKDQDQSAIKAERRKLLLTIASTPPQTQKYVETLAGQEKVPLDALYGMLNVLGVKATDGDTIQDQLEKGAERLKELIAEKPAAVKSDDELARLSKLADDAESEGAIALALNYRQQATDRADQLLEGKKAEVEKIRQDMLDIATTYAQNAATALLNFDHLQAAELYAKAFDAVKDWDKPAAIDYKVKQGDALYDHGYYTTDAAALADALQVYTDASAMVSKDSDALGWARLADRQGEAQQALGERSGDRKQIEASIASYQAALTVRSAATTAVDWATTQNNLANAYYTLGKLEADIPTLRQAVATFDQSLSIYTPSAFPVKWATVTSNRGVAEVDIANFIYASSDNAEMAASMQGVADPTQIPEVVKSRADANAVLTDAVTSLEAAIKIVDRTANLLDWGMLQHTLASAYEQAGEMNHDAAALKDAVSAYDAVLEVHTKDKTPALWLRTANNLAVTLKHLADETSDPVPMRRAVDLYQQVIAITPRDTQAYDWADYQHNLGNALGGLASYENAIPNLQAAEAAYAAAAEVTTLEARGPEKWENLRNAMNTVMVMDGLHSMDRGKIEAARAYAIETRDRLVAAGAPDDAFFTQFLQVIDKVLTTIASK